MRLAGRLITRQSNSFRPSASTGRPCQGTVYCWRYARSMKTSHRIIRVILSLLLFVAGLWMLNHSFFCFWLSGGPPNEYPEIWYQQGIVSGWRGIALLVAAFFAQFTFLQLRKSITAIVMVVFVSAGLCYPHVRAYLLIDQCLDAGGQWSAKYFKCEGGA